MNTGRWRGKSSRRSGRNDGPRDRRAKCGPRLAVALALLSGSSTLTSEARADGARVAAQSAHGPSAQLRRSLTDTSGPALAVGVGYQSAGLGGEFSYALQLPGTPLRVAPHVGAGYLPSELGGQTGWAAGLLASWGRQHRLVLDASYGLVTVLEMTDQGSTIAERAGYGVTASAGYEYMSELGLFARLQAGVSLVTDTDVSGSRWLPTGNLAVGWKPW